MTTFPTPKNSVTATLGSAHAAGGPTLILTAGQGARFPTPSAGDPIHVTVVKASDATYWVVYRVEVRAGVRVVTVAAGGS